MLSFLFFSMFTLLWVVSKDIYTHVVIDDFFQTDDRKAFILRNEFCIMFLRKRFNSVLLFTYMQ